MRQRLCYAASQRAKKSGIPFDIVPDDIDITERCPVFDISLKQGDGKCHDASPTLDRIDPELGYVKGNVAVISYSANRAKGSLALHQIQSLALWLARRTKEIHDA